MKKFEFICKTDIITGETCWFTRENNIFVSNSLRFDKDKAYDIFIKLSCEQPIENYEVLETKTSPNE